MDRWYADPVQRQYKWISTYQNLLLVEQLLPQNQYMRIRYEDVIECPKPTFEDITEFLGLEKCEEVGKGMHKKSLEKWKQAEGYNLRINEDLALVANYFGYNIEKHLEEESTYKINKIKKGFFLFKDKLKKQLKYRLHI